ncbi:hypothetical protein RV13_GL002258 [Enterococcus raffinosus]|nr:hypothetical protein RV13_GL002258 [Enterococcus raffinosus]
MLYQKFLVKLVCLRIEKIKSQEYLIFGFLKDDSLARAF